MKAFLPKKAPSLPMRLEDRVVVVGVGIAGLTVARELASLGFRHVQIVSRDGRFGGKCLHWGCIPSEFSFSGKDRTKLSPKQFVEGLGALVKSELSAFGFPLIQGEVSEVRGRTAHLTSGEQLPFDRIVLCTGNAVTPPTFLSTPLTLGQFWDAKPGKLVIVSDGVPTSLSLASIAAELGHSVTLLFLRAPTLRHLPSVRFFQKQIERQGVEIKTVRNLIQGNREMSAQVGNKVLRFQYDALFYDGHPRPALPLIDGKRLSFYELDIRTGAFPARPDISCIGDAAGFLSATEAELHATSVIRGWAGKPRLRLKDLGRLPLRFHGKSSLAIVGAPWTLACQNWREIDFGALGWEKIHRLPGKLWYLFNAASRKVEGIQICHPKAGELIALASVLMDYEVSDFRWLTVSAHPDSSEIFKVMIQQIHRDAGNVHIAAEFEETELLLHLPDKAEIQNSCPQWLSHDEWKRGMLSARPHLYYALSLALRKGLEHQAALPRLSRDFPSEGRLSTLNREEIFYSFDPDKGYLDAHMPGRQVRVICPAENS